jgi:hypothetical protein
MFLVTFVTALFCSAATTFQGWMRLFAVVALAWVIAGLLYWKWHSPLPVFIAHFSGAVFGLTVWGVMCHEEKFWADWWEDLPQILTVALFPTTVVSAFYALRFRLWR